jgi:cell division cycle protein 20 (cofactor of APC complex)
MNLLIILKQEKEKNKKQQPEMPRPTNDTKTRNIADFESILDLSSNITSTVVPRWQRKQMQQQQQQSQQQPTTGGGGDRFIPCRSGMEQSFEQSLLSDTEKSEPDSDYSRLLKQELGQEDTNSSRILAFKNKAPTVKEDYQNSMRVLYSQQTTKKADVVKSTRNISKDPVRILDAPDLLDDYYLNLLSWSSTNVLSVALSQSVYLWDASTGSTREFMTLESDDGASNDNYVSSVSWIQQGGSHIAIGTAHNDVQLWDVQAQKQVRSMDGHSARVGALAWNGHILTSGSRDNTIINHDVRVAQHVVGTMTQHVQEVCGLSWSPDGQFLASGANDNTLCIWDAATSQSSNPQPKHVLTEHQAAVKALAWSPHERNLLATGGGTADRCIKFWNASSGQMLNSIDTGSQVCALQWSPFEKELLSSHGYAENLLCLWKYPSMARVKELRGHTQRALHMATSPDGSLVVSCGADETLRFWNVFAPEGKRKSESSVGANPGLSKSGNLRIR